MNQSVAEAEEINNGRPMHNEGSAKKAEQKVTPAEEMLLQISKTTELENDEENGYSIGVLKSICNNPSVNSNEVGLGINSFAFNIINQDTQKKTQEIFSAEKPLLEITEGGPYSSSDIENEVPIVAQEIEVRNCEDFGTDGPECETRSRKRHKSNPDEWKRNIVKHKQNSGEAYLNRSGNEVPEKVFIDFDCKCPLKCGKLSRQSRLGQHELFWRCSIQAKKVFLCGHVKQSCVTRRYSCEGNKSRRQKTRAYYLRNESGESVRVCKRMFLSTIQVSNGTLDRALSKEKTGSFEDGRTGHTPPNKKSDTDINFVKEHINSFPKYQSHYARAENHPDTRYLPQGLNRAIMYSMYTEVCKAENRIPVCLSLYKKVLNDMKLKFKRPKKDTCNKCDQYKAQIDDLEKHKGTEGELDAIKQERDAHHAAANLARSKLQEDIIKCKEEPAQQSTLKGH